MTVSDRSALYDFIYRGLLTEEALDAAGRQQKHFGTMEASEIGQALSLELYEEDVLEPARLMSVVYVAIAAFESSVRMFVSRVLIDTTSTERIGGSRAYLRRSAYFAQSRKDDEEKTKWHGLRGDDLLSYTELGHLPNIMQQNWSDFEPYVRRIDWATSIFSTLERSRNVIMHSGTLETPDIERIGILMRDWNKQVGL